MQAAPAARSPPAPRPRAPPRPAAAGAEVDPRPPGLRRRGGERPPASQLRSDDPLQTFFCRPAAAAGTATTSCSRPACVVVADSLPDLVASNHRRPSSASRIATAVAQQLSPNSADAVTAGSTASRGTVSKPRRWKYCCAVVVRRYTVRTPLDRARWSNWVTIASPSPRFLNASATATDRSSAADP